MTVNWCNGHYPAGVSFTDAGPIAQRLGHLSPLACVFVFFLFLSFVTTRSASSSLPLPPCRSNRLALLPSVTACVCVFFLFSFRPRGGLLFECNQQFRCEHVALGPGFPPQQRRRPRRQRHLRMSCHMGHSRNSAGKDRGNI